MRSILLTVLLCTACALHAQPALFTGSGTFVVPAGVTSITIELIGAGGNGASNGGGGGGGGGYARGTYAVTPGTSYSIVVGAGGSELATIVGGMGILAEAGTNAGTVPNPNVGGGGTGGAGLGGSVIRTGGNGGGGYWTYFGGGGGGAAGPLANGGDGGNTVVYTGSNCLTPGGTAGTGGGAPAGAGGKGAGFTDAFCTVTDPGGNGANYGGGGGGGNGIGSPAGIGGGGLCTITWSVSTAVEEVLPTGPRPFFAPSGDRIAWVGALGTERTELFDATGRALWSGMHIEQQDLSLLRSGVYFLRVHAGGTVGTWKLIKRNER